MSEIRGRYTGTVVVLDEPVSVNGEVEVTVHFPDGEAERPSPPVRQRNWERSRALQDSLRGGLSEELLRQRRGATEE